MTNLCCTINPRLACEACSVRICKDCKDAEWIYHTMLEDKTVDGYTVWCCPATEKRVVSHKRNIKDGVYFSHYDAATYTSQNN